MTAEPGLTPRFPIMTVGPVLVTVEAPRTAKPCAVPRGGAVAANNLFNETVERRKAFVDRQPGQGETNDQLHKEARPEERSRDQEGRSDRNTASACRPHVVNLHISQ